MERDSLSPFPSLVISRRPSVCSRRSTLGRVCRRPLYRATPSSTEYAVARWGRGRPGVRGCPTGVNGTLQWLSDAVAANANCCYSTRQQGFAEQHSYQPHSLRTDATYTFYNVFFSIYPHAQMKNRLTQKNQSRSLQHRKKIGEKTTKHQ